MIGLLLMVHLAAGGWAASAVPSWDCLQFLVGEWDGRNASGVPGYADAGECSFEPKMGGAVLLRTGHAEYPAQNGRPAHVHDDLMVVGEETGVAGLRATFLSDPVPGQPQFRLTYKAKLDGTIDGRFEDSEPQRKPDGQVDDSRPNLPFQTYLRWNLMRKP